MNRENGQLHNRLWFLDDGPLPVASFRQILFFLRSGKVLVDRGIFGIARERIALWLLTISITYHEIRICIRLNSSSLNYFGMAPDDLIRWKIFLSRDVEETRISDGAGIAVPS